MTACITPGGWGYSLPWLISGSAPFILQVLYYYIKGREICLFFLICKKHFMAVKKVRKCSGFVIY